MRELRSFQRNFALIDELGDPMVGGASIVRRPPPARVIISGGMPLEVGFNPLKSDLKKKLEAEKKAEEQRKEALKKEQEAKQVALQKAKILALQKAKQKKEEEQKKLALEKALEKKFQERVLLTLDDPITVKEKAFPMMDDLGDPFGSSAPKKETPAFTVSEVKNVIKGASKVNPTEEKKDQTIKYIGIAVAVLSLIVAVISLVRRK